MKTAFVILDMQEEVFSCAQTHRVLDVVKKQGKFAQICRDRRIPVLGVASGDTFKELNAIEDMFRRVGARRYKKGDESWDAFDDLRLRVGVVGVFDRIILGGAYAGRCVFETALGARDAGIEIYSSKELLVFHIQDDFKDTERAISGKFKGYFPDIYSLARAL